MKKALLLLSFITALLSSCGPDACECIPLLEKKKDKSEYVYGMTNEEYRKWEKCYDAYAGPATATLKCK